jgi:hypothetical protein
VAEDVRAADTEVVERSDDVAGQRAGRDLPVDVGGPSVALRLHADHVVTRGDVDFVDELVWVAIGEVFGCAGADRFWACDDSRPAETDREQLLVILFPLGFRLRTWPLCSRTRA